MAEAVELTRQMSKAIAEEYDLIVYAGYIGFHVPKGCPHIHYNFMEDAN